MKENERIPAYFDEKDLSSDFLEYLADNGQIVWNNRESGEQIGLFFFENVPASVKYHNKANCLKFRFFNAKQKLSFKEMFDEEIADGLKEQEIKMTETDISATEMNLYFWWE